VVLARADEPHGELVLRRRGDVVELICGGLFAMDTADTSTERALAEVALGELDGDRPLDVLVGGLGLGFTVAAVLADDRVGRLDVVELSPAVIGWVAGGLVPATAGVLDDPRVRVHTSDVRTLVPRLPAGGLDAVLLDVDNGPGFLLHPANAEVYGGGFLAGAVRALRPGGVLAVWSSHPSPELLRSLGRVGVRGREVLRTVDREGRELLYAIYLVHADDGTPPPRRPLRQPSQQAQ
jgi:spermidine synthase